VIKRALGAVEEENIQVQCVGAPRYRLIVKSSDYITAESLLKEAAESCINAVLDEGGEGIFQRELEKI
jgi:translation initiation factor 2 subunit 1